MQKKSGGATFYGKKGLKPINVYLPPEVIKGLKIRAVHEGSTLQKLMQKVLIGYESKKSSSSSS
jgi:predicted DNA binding CopG/RHH family protein